jgi:hypothetical protein
MTWRGLVAALLVTASAYGQGGPIDLDRARALFVQAKALSEQDDGALWGRRMYGPMLFVDPATRYAVANRADQRGRLDRQGDDLYTGVLPEAIALGNTALEWGGRRWTMLLWPLGGDATATGTLMMHECFHRVQTRLGFPMTIVDNHHLDTSDGRTWLRLEWRALATALEHPDDEHRAIRDALLFRAERRGRFEMAEEEERALELNEGIAEYTGLRLGGATAEQQRARTVAGLRRYDRSTGGLGRSFAYASGPAYGLLLDRAKPGWPRRLKRVGDLGTMLAKNLRLTDDDFDDDVRARAAVYGHDEIVAEESARDEAQQERQRAFHDRYVDGPVLLIPLTGEISFSYSPHGVQALHGVGTVYASMRLSGPWGILEAPGGALLIDGAERRVSVPAPAADAPSRGTITGDGWTLRLERGWVLKSGPRAQDFRVMRR